MDTRRVKRSRNNNTVKYMKRKPIVSRTSFRKALAFQKEIETIPIYFINAHSCLCGKEGECMGEEVDFFFEIPSDTYLLTYGEPGDYSCLTEASLDILLSNSETIRDFLTVHSASNLRNLSQGKAYSFFGQLMRATQSIEGEKLHYPNINYSFNPDKEGTQASKNKYGVFRIDENNTVLSMNTISNRLSVIPQNSRRKNWFLKDIIHEVYARTGISKGIFLNGGCLSSCSRENITGPLLKKAGEIISHANMMYPTVRETLTRNEMENRNMYIPVNYGLSNRYSKIHPAVAKELVDAGLFRANDLLKNKNLWANNDDVREFRELINKKKKKKPL
jgi:hypothetical protein